MRFLRVLCGVLLGFVCPVPSAQEPDGPASLTARYESELVAQRWDKALELAETAVNHARSAPVPQSDALIDALCRLGFVQLALRDFSASEATYREAVRLSEEAGARLVGHRSALAPLKGLAAALMGRGQHEHAIPVLEQALLVSSRADGVFAPSQADALKSLAEAQTSLGRFTEAENTFKKYVQVHEHAYGERDPRTLAARVGFADWYVYVGELGRARALLRVAITDAESSFGRDGRELIEPLRALGRTYSAQLLYGSRIVGRLGDSEKTHSVWIGHRVRGYVPPQWLSTEDAQALEGERALMRALDIAESTSLTDAEVLDTLVSLGDWFEFKSAPERALTYYRRAHALARSTFREGSAELFSYPFNIHMPPVEARGEQARHGTARFVLVEYAVTAAGSTDRGRIIQSNATSQEEARALRAIGHALFRPRIVNDQPLATEGLRHRFVFK